MERGMTTRSGGGIATGMDTLRSTRSKKSSTVSSASGSAAKGISTDVLLRSIHEQDYELRKAYLKPAWVLMSPWTQYEIQKIDSILVYMGSSSDKGILPGSPALMITGIPVMTLPWMPDGIVVVTDRYDADPLMPDLSKLFWKYTTSPIISTTSTTSTADYYKLSYDYLRGGSIGFDTAAGSGATYKSSADFTVSFDPDLKISTAPSKFSLSDFDKPSEQIKHEWSDPVFESSEPDPDSIYGKALARARAGADKKEQK